MLALLLSTQLMHSHNDYAQKHPFYTAWENHFDSIEVDVFPVNGKLLVGHNDKELNPDRTIQSLYLNQMSKIQESASHSPFYSKSKTIWLLIDVKRNGEEAYRNLKEILRTYPEFANGSRGIFTFIISGDRAIASIAADKGKIAGIDGRFTDLGKGYSKEQMPWISADWSDYFKWDGKGSMPAEEAAKMKSLASSVHKEGRLLRFWGSPDFQTCWEAQAKAGVDIINTDHLAELAKWRNSRKG